MKVRTFSRVYPSYHPKKGQATHFAEKILNTLGYDCFSREYFGLLITLNPKLDHAILVAFRDSLWGFKSRQSTNYDVPVNENTIHRSKRWSFILRLYALVSISKAF